MVFVVRNPRTTNTNLKYGMFIVDFPFFILNTRIRIWNFTRTHHRSMRAKLIFNPSAGAARAFPIEIVDEFVRCKPGIFCQRSILSSRAAIW